MDGYVPPRARFRQRVADELRLMIQRCRALEDQDCFWILELDKPDEKVAGVAVARRARSRSRPRVLARPGLDDGPDSLGPLLPPMSETAPPGERPGRNRFVQFLMPAGHPWFMMDLPSCTLDPIEGEILLRERTRFFRAKDRPALAYSQKTVKEHDPVCRQYLVGDEEDAADDIAFVLFDLYSLPVTTPLYLTAASFEGCSCWFERGEALHDLPWPRPLGSAGCPRCRGGERTA